MTYLIVLAAVVMAAPQLATNPSATAERAIAEVEQRFEHALEQHDKAEIESVTAETFIWVHALDGRVDSRSVFMANAVRGMGLSRQRNDSSTFDRTVTVYGNAAVVTSRVRSRSPGGERETWLRQSRIYVRDDGGWKLSLGQGTRMYDGPVTRSDLYSRYAGTYLLPDGRRLVMEWDGDSLLATLPNGSRSQVFLKSPTEEAIATPERFLFVLDATGHPTAVRLMRDTSELWQAEREREKGEAAGAKDRGAALLAAPTPFQTAPDRLVDDRVRTELRELLAF